VRLGIKKVRIRIKNGVRFVSREPVTTIQEGHMKRFAVCIALIALGLGWGARAEGFTVGLALGLPTLAEVHAGYETDGFGVRAHTSYLFFAALGLDGYAIFPTDWGAWRAGLSATWLTEGFMGTGWLCARALLGVALNLGSGVALALEWRPGYPFLISPGPGGPGGAEAARSSLLQYLLLSFSLAFELSF
jgi:hypothetical protein